jgi:hypothetical protein
MLGRDYKTLEVIFLQVGGDELSTGDMTVEALATRVLRVVFGVCRVS